jgi:hypothetical protein
VSVKPGETWCYNHDPARAEERRRAASRAGKAKPSREIGCLKEQLDGLAEDVRGGALDPKVGAVVNQIYNTKLRALEAERQIRETDQLAQEIEELKREYGLAG